MLPSNFKRSAVTLAVAAGVLAAAAPSSALASDHPSKRAHGVTIEAAPVVTFSAPRASLGRENTIEALRTPQSYSFGASDPGPF